MEHTFAVVTEGVKEQTLVEVLSFTEDDKIVVRALNSAHIYTTEIDSAIPCFSVLRVLEDKDDLKKGDIVYELSLDEDTGILDVFDQKNHQHKIHQTSVEVVDSLEGLEPEVKAIHQKKLVGDIDIGETAKGLMATAIEKVIVMGYEEATPDIEKLRETLEDLVDFWELDERLLKTFDETIENIK